MASLTRSVRPPYSMPSSAVIAASAASSSISTKPATAGHSLLVHGTTRRALTSPRALRSGSRRTTRIGESLSGWDSRLTTDADSLSTPTEKAGLSGAGRDESRFPACEQYKQAKCNIDGGQQHPRQRSTPAPPGSRTAMSSPAARTFPAPPPFPCAASRRATDRDTTRPRAPKPAPARAPRRARPHDPRTSNRRALPTGRVRSSFK